MDNTTKTLIIVIIILVGVLGLAGGFILQGILIKNNNSTANQTNTSINSNTTSTSTTTQNSDESSNNRSEFLSEGEAIDIAEANVNIPVQEDYYIYTVFNPDLGDTDPAHWSIIFKDRKTDKSIVAVSIDARTGTINKISYY